MSERMVLVIGNKTYSSWSMRAWLALKATGAPFDELLVPLDQSETRLMILRHSPSGRMPALKIGPLTVWDSLAICEYLAENFPDAGLWPQDPAVRAVARSVCAEMHSGFPELRRHMSMDLKSRKPGQGRTPEVLAEIDRITGLWRLCRNKYGGGGPFLFGRFTAADAMFAPVVMRFATYEVELDAMSRAYCDAIQAWPAVQEWTQGALAEPWVLVDH